MKLLVRQYRGYWGIWSDDRCIATFDSFARALAFLEAT